MVVDLDPTWPERQRLECLSSLMWHISHGVGSLADGLKGADRAHVLQNTLEHINACAALGMLVAEWPASSMENHRAMLQTILGATAALPGAQ